MKRLRNFFLLLIISILTLFSAQRQIPVIKTSQHLLKIGDDVQIRGGGPAMTIESIRQQKIRCSFINKRYEYMIEDFDPEALEPIEITIPKEYNLEDKSKLIKILTKLIILQNSLE